MNAHQKSSMLVIVYDSVTNSVFESQVYAPLIAMHEAGIAKEITIATFESNPAAAGRAIGPLKHPAIRFLVLKRLPLVSRATLLLAAAQLFAVTRDRTYTVVRARGPLAGVIGQWLGWFFWLTGKRTRLVVQARGLCAEEFRFACEQQELTPGKRLIAWWRKRLFKAIERRAYAWDAATIIEAVSAPLASHLEQTYASNPERIVIAAYDGVPSLPPAYIAVQKAKMHAVLGIPPQRTVFCYSGSCKPWQCAEETIAWFEKEIATGVDGHLVIFSQDTEAFKRLVAQHGLPADRVVVHAVAPSQLLDYLCVADVGILLRKPDIVNWVSRPTKLLEYQAVGLKIVHNNTIGILATRSS